MKLIETLVKELPSSGGYPETISDCIHSGNVRWMMPPWGCSPMAYRLSTHEIVTREQYEAALAATKEPKKLSFDTRMELLNSALSKETPNSLLAKLKSYDNEGKKMTTWKYIKGSEKDFVGAPEWCDRVVSYGGNPKRLGDADKYVGCTGITHKYCIGSDWDIHSHREPVAEWDGVGLPPVGCICEALVPWEAWKPWSWSVVKVVESGIKGAENECLVYNIKTTRPSWVDEFRPLRTEANKKRDEAIHEIASMIGRGTFFEDAKRIYDAGYRKQ